MGIIMKTGWADLVINDELTDAGGDEIYCDGRDFIYIIDIYIYIYVLNI